jgi:tetratricopeptide (TPR) repeat protein
MIARLCGGLLGLVAVMPACVLGQTCANGGSSAVCGSTSVYESSVPCDSSAGSSSSSNGPTFSPGPAVLYNDSISSEELLELAGFFSTNTAENPEDLPPPLEADSVPLAATVNYEGALFFYSRGYTRFWEGDYFGALKDLERSVEYNARDARSWYYKGIVELAIGYEDRAKFSLAQGLRAESLSFPPQPLISMALTRVQGPLRLMLEEARRSLPRR